jgi:Ca-activated chloride channel family protein
MAATSLPGQDQPFSIRVDVDTVVVDVIVQEQNGRFLTDLKQADFEILENGMPQDLVYFASTETPRSLLLLFDLSGSTDPQRPFMAEALNAFMTRMRQQDRLAIASFAFEFQMLMNWRSVAGKPMNFYAPSSHPRSDVYWAIDQALKSFKDEKARKGIIVMTDGRDSSMFEDVMRSGRIWEIEADKEFQKLVQKIRKESIPIYIVAMNTDYNRDFSAFELEYGVISQEMGQPAADKYLAAVRSRMEWIAAAAGGRILYPQTLADVVPLYDAIGRDLGSSYSLAYTSKNQAADGKARRIEVRVRRNGVKVTQSRDSYTR